jgi:GNAT superfamily N-acetyltransferase
MASVRPATTHDLPRIGRALAAAFETDPIWHWLTPDLDHYRRRAPAFFAADARLRLGPHGRVLVSDDLGGCAIWCAPDHWKGTLTETARMLAPSGRLLGRRLLDGVRAIGAIEKAHTQDPPHWYLSVLGTDPDHQGKGIGSALIRAVTDECDRDGIPAYLESSKEANLAFYSRHGFVADEPMRLPKGGPLLWPMWRDPR